MKNLKRALIGLKIVLFVAIIFGVIYKQRTSEEAASRSCVIDNMPLIIDDPFANLATLRPPKPERGQAVKKWLEPGVRIRVPGASGSGTIIWYDEKTSYAYVQSCGHFWENNMSANEAHQRNLTVDVQVFFKNGEKLSQPATYKATVLFYHNNQKPPTHLCQDCSLFRFKSDYKPIYFPIAPQAYVLQQGQRLHSVGCDQGEEVAHYSVCVVGERGSEWPDLVTTENSPRPGRSGGGLISDDSLLVGICWGTSDYNGAGTGYFTPLRTIRYYNEMNGYGWINNVGGKGSLARRVPIVDRNNVQGHYPNDYIPVPDEK